MAEAVQRALTTIGTCSSRPAPAPASRWRTWFPTRPRSSRRRCHGGTAISDRRPRPPRFCRRSAPAARREPKFAILKGRGNFACRTGCTRASPTSRASWSCRSTSSLGREVRRLPPGPATPRPAIATISTSQPAIEPGQVPGSWPRVPRRKPMPQYRRTPSPSGLAEDARQADVVVTNHALLAIDALETGTSCRARRGRG